jgi:hypothetical protein
MTIRKYTLVDALTSRESPLADAFETLAADDAADARCGVLVRVSAELRRGLKLAAIARNSTVQALMLEAITLILQNAKRSAPERRFDGRQDGSKNPFNRGRQ